MREALARYMKPHVLVVDEVGYLAYGDDAANVLYHVVNDRHIRRRAMIFTTNKHPKRWGDVLHDDDLADAIVDRILERGRLLRLDGPSLRTKHLPEDQLQFADHEVPGDRRVSGKETAEFPERTHPTADGWRVSEINSDVPGGFTESSRFAELVAERCGAGEITGDPGAAWTSAVAEAAPLGGVVALLSAPGWVEDVQVVAHLAARLRASGLVAHLASPQQLHWVEGRAHLANDAAWIPLDAIVRFYQAEWLARLPCRAAWLPLSLEGVPP